jgi:hypothetical protein
MGAPALLLVMHSIPAFLSSQHNFHTFPFIHCALKKSALEMPLYQHFLHLKMVSLATLHRQWDFQILFIFYDYSKWEKKIMTPWYATHMLPLT